MKYFCDHFSLHIYVLSSESLLSSSRKLVLYLRIQMYTYMIVHRQVHYWVKHEGIESLQCSVHREGWKEEKSFVIRCTDNRGFSHKHAK